MKKSFFPRYFPALLILLSVLIHSYLIFQFFPPTQFHKYTIAAKMYIHDELPKERLLDFSMTYFYLHVLIKKLFANSNLIVSWIQILLVAFSSMLLFQLLMKFFRFSVALIGTVAFMVNTSVILFVQTFEPEPLVIFLLLGFVTFTLRPRYLDQVIAGIFFGLGVLTRPNFIPVLFVVPIFYLFNRGRGRRSWKLKTISFFVPVLLSLFILWGRNLVILNSFYPSTMNPGQGLFEGNNPNSWGYSSKPLLINEVAQQYPDQPDYHHAVYRRFVRRISEEKLSVQDIDRYWAAKAINFIKDHPRRYAQQLSKKVLHFFHAYEWHDLLNVFQNERRLKDKKIPTIPFALISAMALMGLLILKSSWDRCFLLYAAFFCQLGSMMVFYVTARQRVAIISIFIFFACATLQILIENRRRLFVVIGLIPLLLLLYIRTDIMKEDRHLWDSVQRSRNFLRDSYRNRDRGDFLKGTRLSSLALASAPWLIDSRRPSNLSFEPLGFVESGLQVIVPKTFSKRFDRAILCIEAGRLEEARQILEKLQAEGHRFNRDYYQSSEPNYYLGKIALKKGNKQEAVGLLKKGIRRSPGDPSILALLFVLTNDPECRFKLYRYFDDINAHFYLGRACFENDVTDGAVNHFSYVVRKMPEFTRGNIYLIAALSAERRYEEAAFKYMDLINKGLNQVMLEERMIPLFKEISERAPDDPLRQFVYGVVLRQFGYHRQALKAQRVALHLDPDNTRIKKEISFLEKILTTEN